MFDCYRWLWSRDDCKPICSSAQTLNRCIEDLKLGAVLAIVKHIAMEIACNTGCRPQNLCVGVRDEDREAWNEVDGVRLPVLKSALQGETDVGNKSHREETSLNLICVPSPGSGA